MTQLIDAKNVFLQKQHIVSLLRQHPELLPLQQEIDRLMDGAVTSHNRCVILQRMLKDKTDQMSIALVQMAESLEKLKDMCQKAATEIRNDQPSN